MPVDLGSPVLSYQIDCLHSGERPSCLHSRTFPMQPCWQHDAAAHMPRGKVQIHDDTAERMNQARRRVASGDRGWSLISTGRNPAHSANARSVAK